MGLNYTLTELAETKAELKRRFKRAYSPDYKMDLGQATFDIIAFEDGILGA